MKTPLSLSLAAHIIVALMLSYGLSLFFWLGQGVFNLPGFILISALAAGAGVLVGWLSKKHLWLTGLATIVFRLGIYFFMMRGS